MKLSMGVLDLVALVRDIRSACVGMRVHQVYDSDQRTYHLRLSETGGRKVPLVIESGARMHPTRFQVARRSVRGGLCMKLRKHLKGRRLTGVRQLGTDRVVDLRFGSGANELHLLVEFYAGGNIILTDASLRMLAVLRIFQYESGARVAPGEVYPLAEAARAVVAGEGDSAATPGAAPPSTVFDFTLPDAAIAEELAQRLAAAMKRTKPTRKARGGCTLKALLLAPDMGLALFGADLLQHAALGVGWSLDALLHEGSSGATVPDASDVSTARAFVAGCRGLAATLSSVQEGAEGVAGYLLVQRKEADGAGEAGLLTGEVASWDEVLGAAGAAATAAAAAAAAVEEEEDGGPGRGEADVLAGLQGDAEAQAGPQQTFHDVWEVVGVTPVLLRQHANAAYVLAPTFAEAYDEAAARVVAQRQEKARSSALSAAHAKVQDAKDKVEGHVAAIRAAQAAAERSAAAVEGSRSHVQAALDVVNRAVASGMDWGDLERMVAAEAAGGNAVAASIVKLDVGGGRMTLALPDPYWQEGQEEDEAGGDSDSSEDAEGGGGGGTWRSPAASMDPAARLAAAQALFHGGEEWSEGGRGDGTPQEAASTAPAHAAAGAGESPSTGGPTVQVQVRLDLSAAGNAREHWRSAKAAKGSEDKAAAAGARVVAEAEAKAAHTQATLHRIGTGKGSKQAVGMAEGRKAPYFSKFRWFISSEGVLVLAGRDMHQNETLVKRYLRPQDAYVHGDVHGAASCIVRNPSTSPEAAALLPTLAITLNQAATFSACLSKAWKGGMPCNAWWVHANQVSKTAQSGEYLPTGSFMIRGTKNMLHVAKLELGIALLFKVEQEVLQKRGTDRLPRAREQWQAALSGETSAVQASPPQPPRAASPATAVEETPPPRPGSPPAAATSAGTAAEAAPQTQPDSDAAQAEAAQPEAAQEVPDAASPPAKRSDGQPKRGQRFRRRKAKAKYSDQDEEERALAMAALGHGVGDADVAGTPGASGSGVGGGDEEEEWDGSAAPATASAPVVSVAAAAVGIRGVGGAYFEEGQEGEVAPWLALDRDVAEAAPVESSGEVLVHGMPLRGEFLDVARLVPSLGRGDVSTMALFMLAPWGALGAAYPFKVRLQPGTLKAGKALKAAVPIMQALLTEWRPKGGPGTPDAGSDARSVTTAGTRDTLAGGGSRVGQRCMALARAVPEEETMRTMLGDVKVMAPASASAAVKKAARAAGKGKGKKGGRR